MAVEEDGIRNPSLLLKKIMVAAGSFADKDALLLCRSSREQEHFTLDQTNTPE